MTGRIADAHPGVSIELAAASGAGMMTRRTGDIAAFIGHAVPEPLKGRACGTIAWAVYGGTPGGADDSSRWVGFDESLGRTAAAEWLRRNVAEAAISYRADSLRVAAEAVRNRMGLGVLPMFLGEGRLERRQGPLEGLEARLFIATHAPLHNVPRIRAFVEFVASRLASVLRMPEA